MSLQETHRGEIHRGDYHEKTEARGGVKNHKSRKAWRGQEQEKTRKRSPLKLLEGARLCQHLNFKLLTSRTMRGQIFEKDEKVFYTPFWTVFFFFFTVGRTDNMKSPLLKKFPVYSTVLL